MVVIIGDIHARFRELIHIMRKYPHGTTFMQLGDFGAGVNPKDIESLQFEVIKTDLQTREHKLYIVRGNHEDPAYFNGDNMDDRFKLVPDYHTEVIQGKKYLFLGGSISIDRSVKKLKQNQWWEGEGFVFDPVKLSLVRDIDIVISHNVPHFCFPQAQAHGQMFLYAKGCKDLGYPGDPSLVEDVKKERMLFTDAYNLIKKSSPNLSAWYYGHYHHFNTEYIDNVKFKLLNINESSE